MKLSKPIKFLSFGIILLAFFMRFWQIEQRFTFSLEENNMLYQTSDMVSGNRSYLLGLEATGYIHHLFLAPWYLYLMSFLLKLSSGEPLFFAYLHSAVGVLTVATLIGIGVINKKIKIGLVAGFIYAVWLKTVEIDRTFMAVNLVPLVSAVLILFLSLARNTKKRIYFVLAGVSLGLGLSLHYQVLVLVFLSIIWIWRKHKKELGYFITPIVSLLFPLIVFDFRHQGFNLIGLFLTLEVLIKGQSPYGSSHFANFLYVPAILATAYFLTKLNWKLILVSLSILGLSEIFKFIAISPGYSYQITNRLVGQVLDKYDGKVNVCFKAEGSYSYKYLLFLRAKQRGVDPNAIRLYEPWDTCVNNSVVVENAKIITL